MRIARKLKHLILFIFLLPISGLGQASGQQQVHRVLFVGNSYTYYNSMPQLFAAISEHHLPDHKVETKFIGGGGATLKKHWEVGQVLEELKSGNWDFVVLQDQSKLGSDDLTTPDSPNQFFKYAEMLDKEIIASGAETVFFMTWSRQDRKNEQVYLSNAYTSIAEKLGSKVAPVGTVWSLLRDDPSLNLYMDDGSHPSVSGSFVAAMTLSSVIFEAGTEPVPGALFGFEILSGGQLSNERTQLTNLSVDDVERIQKCVADVMKDSG